MKCGICRGEMKKDNNGYGDFWNCEKCDVRQYKDGTQADKELRVLRGQAHAAFDEWWKSKGISQYEAYGILAKRFNMSTKNAHMRKFGKKQCKKVIEIFKAKKAKEAVK